jgi:hypothetical protein
MVEVEVEERGPGSAWWRCGWLGLLGSVGEVCVMMLRNRGGWGVGGLGEARSLGRDLSI